MVLLEVLGREADSDGRSSCWPASWSSRGIFGEVSRMRTLDNSSIKPGSLGEDDGAIAEEQVERGRQLTVRRGGENEFLCSNTLPSQVLRHF